MAEKKPMTTVRRTGGVVYMEIQRGDVVADDDVRAVQECLAGRLNEQGVTAVVLDFTTVQRVSSTTIAFLVKLQARLAKMGLRYMFSGLSRDKLVDAANDRFAYEVFKVLDVDRLLAVGAERTDRAAEHEGPSSRKAVAC
jgi:anti-anti-sigma regulatory factor